MLTLSVSIFCPSVPLYPLLLVCNRSTSSRRSATWKSWTRCSRPRACRRSGIIPSSADMRPRLQHHQVAEPLAVGVGQRERHQGAGPLGVVRQESCAGGAFSGQTGRPAAVAPLRVWRCYSRRQRTSRRRVCGHVLICSAASSSCQCCIQVWLPVASRFL